MSARTMTTIAAAIALLAIPSVAQAPAIAGTDDPTTTVNEAATLDTSRVMAKGARPSGSPTAITVVQAYADQRGMTCRAPRDAELDDVFLTLPIGPNGSPYLHEAGVGEVDLDTALQSAGKRVVLLACDHPTTEGA